MLMFKVMPIIEVVLRFEDIELTVSDIKNLVNYKDLNEKVKVLSYDWTMIYVANVHYVLQTILFLMNTTMKLYTKGLVRRVLGPSVSVMKYDEVSSSSFSNSKDFDLILAPFQSPLQWILMVLDSTCHAL